VESGESALRTLRTAGPFDVLVTDLSMPGMSGRELASRTMQELPDLPVLFVTGHHAASLDDLIGPRAHVLHKPFSPDGLSAALERLLAAERRSGPFFAPSVPED
jgi:CheY-like chemotaxis protein